MIEARARQALCSKHAWVNISVRIAFCTSNRTPRHPRVGRGVRRLLPFRRLARRREQ